MRQEPLPLTRRRPKMLRVSAPPDPETLRAGELDLNALFLLLGGVSLLVGRSASPTHARLGARARRRDRPSSPSAPAATSPRSSSPRAGAGAPRRDPRHEPRHPRGGGRVGERLLDARAGTLGAPAAPARPGTGPRAGLVAGAYPSLRAAATASRRAAAGRDDGAIWRKEEEPMEGLRTGRLSSLRGSWPSPFAARGRGASSPDHPGRALGSARLWLLQGVERQSQVEGSIRD